jgi:hypothetical protein
MSSNGRSTVIAPPKRGRLALAVLVFEADCIALARLDA